MTRRAAQSVRGRAAHREPLRGGLGDWTSPMWPVMPLPVIAPNAFTGGPWGASSEVETRAA